MRRPALLCCLTSLALAAVGLGAAPAQAASASSKPPTQQHAIQHYAPVEVRAARTTRASQTASVTTVDCSGGSNAVLPATNAQSTWLINDLGGLEPGTPQGNAFQSAVNLWARSIKSSVPIKVDATFTTLPPRVLGSAGPSAGYITDNTKKFGANVVYPSALADARTGYDVSTDYIGLNPPPPASDIDSEFSTDMPWYFGTDGKTPLHCYDFMSVVMHELGHGLGVVGSADYNAGSGSYERGSGGTPIVEAFDAFNSNASGTALYSTPNGSTLGAAFTPRTGGVFWNGAHGVAANNNLRPRLYAPTTWESGSSIAHLDESTYRAGNPNALLTPILSDGEAEHSPGPLLLGMMQDLGWPDSRTKPDPPTAVTGTRTEDVVTVTWTTPAFDGGSPVTGYTVVAHAGSTSTSFAAAGTGPAKTIYGLTAGTPYTFTVTATNAIGTSSTSATSSPVTPLADTTPPTVVLAATPLTLASADGSIAFTGADANHPSPVLTYSCTYDGLTAPCTSPFSWSGTADSTAHAFSVTAKDAANNTSSPATRAWTTDAVLPTVLLSSTPADPTVSPTAAFTFSGSDNNGSVSFVCAMDAAVATSCASGQSYPALTDGVHTFTVKAKDLAGNLSSPASRTFRVDTLPPALNAQALPAFTIAARVGLVFGASDPSGVASYDVRYRRAAYTGGFGAMAYPGAWQGTSARNVSVPATTGSTYCFSMRARDALGHVSPWTGERCTAVGLDDRSMVASTGWTRLASTAYYKGTYSRATSPNRTLTRTGVQTRRIALVTTTCSGCGVVGVYWNGTLVRKISLAATTATNERILSVVDLGAVKAGTLVVRTLNSGRTHLDGVVLSRT